MGLGVNLGPCFQFEVDSHTGTPPAANYGTGVASGSSNADGATTALITSLAQDCQYVVIGVTGISTTTEDNSALFDLMWDPAGGTAWVSFIDNLIVGGGPAATAGTVGQEQWYHFPVLIPKTTSLGGRCRKTGATSLTMRVCVYVFGQPRNPDMWWYGTKVESLGINEGTSKGTAHTPGNSGSFSSYATIGTSTYRYGALQFGAQTGQSTQTAVAYYWQLGVGSAQIPGSPTFYYSGSTAEVVARTQYNGPIWCDIPASTAVQCRGTCSGTAQAQNVAAYGVT